jgi:thiamine biosynthesis lipoprotein ApbE
MCTNGNEHDIGSIESFVNRQMRGVLTGSINLPIVELKNQALSVSGIGIQGSHIVSPRQTESTQYAQERVWVSHEEAAYADAWSTACLLMTESELETAKGRITIYCN